MTPRAVVVAHRETMVAEGIAAALREYPGLVPLAVATTAAEGERVGATADAVALDQLLPGAKSAAGRLRRKGVRVVFLGDGEPDDGEDGIRVSTRAPIATLAAVLVPGVTLAASSSVSALTPRQREILALVAEGMAGKQVARHLGISAKTVERHKTRIFSKLGVNNQTAAVHVVLGYRWGRDRAWNRSST